MHALITPLRYPGGKGQLANYIKLLIKKNELEGGCYAEVYAGGAAIAMSLLDEGYVSQVFINDIDLALYSFWSIVLNQPDELSKLVADTPVDMSQWHHQKAIQADFRNHTQLELAFATFFLNRTNRSGILKGGVIGGKDQAGKWKLDARYNKTRLINRIHRIAKHADKITVLNLDAAKFIRTIIPKLPKKTFVFLDPPYYVKGKGLYEHHYTHADHVRIAKNIKTYVKRPWLVSYDDVPEIQQLYSGFHQQPFKLSYSAQARYQGGEILIHSERLSIPEIKTPLKISNRTIREA
jgi:DNA adenine methylase